jgi:acyl-CoA synthetase (NDP forming)
VRAAYGRIVDSLRERAPEARVDGVRVEEMVSGGVEIIIGLKRDAQFGPVIMFGLGGI